MNTLYGYPSISTPYGLYGWLSTTGISSTSSSQTSGISSTSSAADAYQSEISAYGQLLSSLANFQYAMQQLYAPQQGDVLTASSSNTAIANASATNNAKTASYNLNVSQLAQSQTVQSSAFADAGSTVVGSGSLTIQTGTYASGSNTFTSDGTSPVSITISNGTLNSIANAINNSGAGVTASVQQSNGTYILAIASSATGASKNVKITVNDSDGNDTDTSGLSQLAYDPTATAGAGKNMTLTQSGLDASYTVNSVSATSSSNTGISLAAHSLISAFKVRRGSLHRLMSDASSPLQYSTTVSQLSSSLGSQAASPLSNGSSTLRSLSQLGIVLQYAQNAGQTGNLTLSSNTLQAAFNLDQNGAANLIALSAQGFNTLTTAYSAPGYGIVPQTVNQLQRLQQSANTQTSWSRGLSFNLADYLSQQNRSGTSQTGRFSASQILALTQYASVMSIGQPYALNALLIGNIGSSFSALA